MTIRDVLLPLVGEPNEAARTAIHRCVALCGDFGAEISALAIEEDVLFRPKVVILSDNGTSAETVRSVTDARGLLQVFDHAAARFCVPNEQNLRRLASEDIAEHIAKSARLKDLSLVPVKSHHVQSEKIVERLLFGSGRPILICPEELAAELPVVLDDVLVAWDHSAPAARAIGDALPMLRAAARVRVVTATDVETPEQAQSGAALVSHLAEHGVEANFETIRINGSSIGKVFEAYVRDNPIDLLVMGAYHHSRLNEIVWGGATKTIIGRPPCWVMMSR